MEATLTTETAVYSLSSIGSLLDGSSAMSGGLFGAISWPRCQFNVEPGISIEQQVLLPHDGSAAAFSWQLRNRSPQSLRLEVRPLFAGCSPWSYRDRGFQFQSAEQGGRLVWLASVLGPTISADTNGAYDDDFQQIARETKEELVSPGTFQFDLSDRPSVLILGNDRVKPTRNGHLIGTFLAGLLPEYSTLVDSPKGTSKFAASLLAA
jgi:hypothetical protein